MTTFECPHGCIDCNTCRTSAAARSLSAAESERDRLKRAYDTDLARASEITAGELARADAAEARAARAEADVERWVDAASKADSQAITVNGEHLATIASLRRSLEEARRLLAECPAAWRLLAYLAEQGGDDPVIAAGRKKMGARIDAFLATPSPEGKPEAKETDRG